MSDLTPHQRAKRIVDSSKNGSYGDGKRIVETLLVHRNVEDLSLEEMELLLKEEKSESRVLVIVLMTHRN